MEMTLEIRRIAVGKYSLPVASALEELGKIVILTNDYISAHQAFDEAYKIRSKIIRDPKNEEITRISILLIYLDRKIEKELNQNTDKEKSIYQKNEKLTHALKGTVEETRMSGSPINRTNNYTAKEIQLFQGGKRREGFSSGEDCPPEKSSSPEVIIKRGQGLTSPKRINSVYETQSSQTSGFSRDKHKNYDSNKYSGVGQIPHFNLAAGDIYTKEENGEDILNRMVRGGVDRLFAVYENTNETELRRAEGIIFLLSLNKQQINLLNRGQSVFQGDCPFYLDEQFITSLTDFQEKLLKSANIAMHERDRYLKWGYDKFGIDNIKVLESTIEACRHHQNQKITITDREICSLIEENSTFFDILDDAQNTLFQNIVQLNLPIALFIQSISLQQLNLFEKFVRQERTLLQKKEFDKNQYKKLNLLFRNEISNYKDEFQDLSPGLNMRGSILKFIKDKLKPDKLLWLNFQFGSEFLAKLDDKQIVLFAAVRRMFSSLKKLAIKSENFAKLNPELWKKFNIKLKKFIKTLNYKQAYEFYLTSNIMGGRNPNNRKYIYIYI